MKTLVYIDHFKGEIQPASWEALGLGFGCALAIAVLSMWGAAAAVRTRVVRT